MAHIAKMGIVQASFWAVLLVWASAMVYGCQPGERPSTIEMIIEAESLVTTAAQTVGDAIQLGRLDPQSETYGRIYQSLQAADKALDAAWSAYRAGDMVGADGARKVALDAYWAIRPLLLEIAQ
jgi:hypothetical protein